MARCWSCGSEIPGGGSYLFTCPTCEGVEEIKSLHNDVLDSFDKLVSVQRHGFEILSDKLSEVATVVEWGFEEISWQLQQQTDVLRSIDHTLKTPSETKANEWRLHAEELRRRGALEESEEFFLKALNEYRLDYRIYVGLAETYLRMTKFDKAKSFLEKSLPHAPKKEIDYRSYSYRLIGHIYACKEDYNQAVAVLRSSIDLSPTYEDGHYDYSQYCAQIRNTEACLTSLQKAILAKPLYWSLALKERNFSPIRNEVEKLLFRINTEASDRAKDGIAKTENALEKTHEAVSKARQALSVAKEKAELKSSTICNNAKVKLELAKDKVASGDYIGFLEARPIAEESYTIAIEAMNTAVGEQEYYRKRRAEKVKRARKVAILGFIPFMFVGALLGAPLGVILGVIWGLVTKGFGVPDTVLTRAFPITVPIGVFTGLVGAFIYWIHKIKV